MRLWVIISSNRLVLNSLSIIFIFRNRGSPVNLILELVEKTASVTDSSISFWRFIIKRISKMVKNKEEIPDKLKNVKEKLKKNIK